MSRNHRARGRGFTLVELMIVVAVVGVLAVIALVGFRKYQVSAASGEARAMLQSIRGGEDAYKAEVLSYLPCLKSGAGDLSAGANYYPRTVGLGTLDGAKAAWDGWAGGDCWLVLNVRSSQPVRYTFAANAGAPGSPVAPAPGEPPGLPAGAWPYDTFNSPNPWFVAAAVGDYDHDGIYSLMYTSSLNGEVQVVEDTE